MSQKMLFEQEHKTFLQFFRILLVYCFWWIQIGTGIRDTDPEPQHCRYPLQPLWYFKLLQTWLPVVKVVVLGLPANLFYSTKGYTAVQSVVRALVGLCKLGASGGNDASLALFPDISPLHLFNL